MTNDQKSTKKYLIARDCQPGSAKRHFEEVKKLSRSETRGPKVKSNQVRKLNIFTTYNPSLPNIDSLVKKYLPLLRSDENLKELFPASAFNTIYRCNKNYSPDGSFLTGKVLKAIASLVVIVLTSATIIWFLKTYLLVK